MTAAVRAPQVEQAIGYWLISATRCFATAMSDLLAEHCAERGKAYVITPPQWGVIAQLSLEDRQTIGDLAHRLGVDGPSVTNLVKRLEQNGLVRRRRPRSDERLVQVSLTPEARDLFSSLAPVVEQFQEEALPCEHRHQLVDNLRLLIARLAQIAPGTADRNRFDTLRNLVRQYVPPQGDTGS
jgi:DNA-binding MarR family transcriptional regulator